MKKGVLAKLVSLVVIATVFFVLASQSFAQDDIGPDRHEGEEGGAGSGYPELGGEPTPTSSTRTSPSYDLDPGFWKPCLRESGTDCTYPAGDLNKIEAKSIDLKDIYSGFGIVSRTSQIPDLEITYVKFVLDPLLYRTEDGNVFGSHSYIAGEMDYEDFLLLLEGGQSSGTCYSCPADDLEKCFETDPEFPNKFDWPCAEADINNVNNCSGIADLNGPLCEGLQGIGANAGFMQYGTGEIMPVSDFGMPGLGGCKELLAPTDVPARDWFSFKRMTDAGEDTVVEYGDLSKSLRYVFSTYYMPGAGRDARLAAVGRCCGNDALDAGALMIGSSRNSGTFDNYFICVQDRQNNFVWMPAASSNNMGVIWNTTLNLDGKTYRFDAASNTNNWFICDSPDSMAGKVYTDADLEDWVDTANGPLLERYEKLPAYFETISYGTTSSLGGEGGEEGPMTGSGTELIDEHDNSESDFASQSDFENARMDVFGFSESTVCDKDGDRYDGQWTLDPYPEEGWLTDESYPGCSAPSQPYDCDDSRSDVNKGMIDYCDGINPAVNTVDNDCDGDASPCIPLPEDGRPPGAGEEGELLPSEVYKRFMCHQTDDAGVFAECCSYDLGWCMNYMKGRREGGPINTINDFSHYAGIVPEGSNTTNMVLKYVTSSLGRIDVEDSIANDEEFRLGLPKKFYDEKLTNWSSYEYVEFYVWTTTNFVLDIGLAKKKTPFSPENMFKSYVVRFRKPVIEYAVNEPGLRKWMHIKIPIDDIYGEDRLDYFPVDMIAFFTNIKDLRDSGSPEVRVDWNGDTVASGDERYSNYIGIDKFFLTPKSAEIPGGDENYYCSGVWPPTWISDLDRDVPDDEPEGRSACNAIPSYGWTGSRCCGDDTGNDLIDVGHAELADKEFFNDTDAGCWAGNVVVENERSMIVRYGMYYGVEYGGEDLGLHEVVDRDCSRSSCVFSLPLRPEIFISNPHPELYDLVALQGDERITINQSYLPGEAISQIKAEDVPLQVQFKGGEFWACNPADYIKTLESDDGPLLIPDDGEHYFESCQVKGMYFCDHVNGTNMGWSDESIMKYPGSKLTLRDGTEFSLPGDAVPPTNRTEAKYAYNIIKNPGFEEV